MAGGFRLARRGYCGDDVMITMVNWNIDRRIEAAEELLAMNAGVALLQEVGPGALDRLAAAGRQRRGQSP